MKALDRPAAAAAAGLLLALAIAGLHLARVGGDVSLFVRAAPPWTDPSRVPPGLAVVDQGYDGQFYYRLALDPFTDARSASGVTLDMPAYRQQRIAYPLLAWALGGAGDPARVPLALVAVNVAGLAALGWLGGMLAVRSGRHALWGIVLPLYPGFVMTITRDLTEIVAAVCVAAALLLLRTRHTLAAAITLALAVVSRETALLLAAAIGAERIRSGEPARKWTPLLLPALAFVLLQSVLFVRWGETAASEGAGSLDPPLLGLLSAAFLNAQRLDGAALARWGAVLAFVALLAVLGAAAQRGGLVRHEAWAWWAYLGLASVLEANIWANGAVLRALGELGMLTCVAALGAPKVVARILLAAEVAVACAVFVAGSAI